MTMGPTMKEKHTTYQLMFVNIELTLKCNLRCLHCGSTAGKARIEELSSEQWLEVIRDLADLGCEEVCVLGGEPLVLKAWQDIAEEICSLGMSLVLITNGWLIEPEVISRLKQLSRLDRIGVSLDGATAETHDRIRGRAGSFDRALKALWSLRDAGFEVGAITSVSRLNLKELFAMRDLLLNQDITWQLQTVSGHGERWNGEWNLTPGQHYQVAELISKSRQRFGVKALPIAGSHGFGYNSSRLDGYAELPHWPGCAGGIATLGITSAGDVKPCLSQPGTRVVGNLKSEPLRDIWADDGRFARTRGFTLEKLEGFCKSCPHAMVCRAGCPNLSLSATGSDADNPFCLFRLESEGQVPPDPLVHGWIS
jgi:radical SAM protein with 4Fe4S-binding SPASM domain